MLNPLEVKEGETYYKFKHEGHSFVYPPVVETFKVYHVSSQYVYLNSMKIIDINMFCEIWYKSVEDAKKDIFEQIAEEKHSTKEIIEDLNKKMKELSMKETAFKEFK